MRSWYCCLVTSPASSLTFCIFHVILDPCACRQVKLIAKVRHDSGAELTLDYGDHPLQHLLCQYSFIPMNSAGVKRSEIFEDFGGNFEVLIVQSSPQVPSAVSYHLSNNAMPTKHGT